MEVETAVLSLTVLGFIAVAAFAMGAEAFFEGQYRRERYTRERSDSLVQLLAYAALLKAQVEFQRESEQRMAA
jgi:hypothetical protein